VGANGAGKSTLMKILSGALPEHEGEISLDGHPVRFNNPREALNEGIAMVYQELSGVGQLSVMENLFLGRQIKGRAQLLDWPAMRTRAREILATVGLDLNVDKRLDTFSLSIRQLIEIARCMHLGSRVFILDEPTSALSPPETNRLFSLVRRLRGEGKGVVFISHFIEDILEVCDRVTTLVNGRLRSTHPAKGLTKHDLIHEILDGKDLSAESALEGGAVDLAPPKKGEPLLQAAGFSLRGVFDNIDVSIHPGEAVGCYGFVGAGHLELAHCLAGAIRPDAGSIRWRGKSLSMQAPHQAVRQGIAFVAADRASSLCAEAENYKNITLSHLRSVPGTWLTRRKEVPRAISALQSVRCRPPDPFLRSGALSGGNQQKVVIAKWLLGPVSLLVLEEPTRGMDVGAKSEIMELVRGLKKKGAGVFIASSEPELLLAHADRILVMRRGSVTTTLAGCAVDKRGLMRYA